MCARNWFVKHQHQWSSISASKKMDGCLYFNAAIGPCEIKFGNCKTASRQCANVHSSDPHYKWKYLSGQKCIAISVVCYAAWLIGGCASSSFSCIGQVSFRVEIELCCNRCVSSRHHRPALHVLLAAAGHNLCPIHDHCLLSAILIISIKLRKWSNKIAFWAS